MRKAVVLAFLSACLVLLGCSAEQRPRQEHVQPATAGPTATMARVSAVVRNPDNQAGVRSCYERALKSVGRATNGRVDVAVVVGPSGLVRRVALEAPSRLAMVEPCIRRVISRWVFPTNPVEYDAQFPLVLHSR